MMYAMPRTIRSLLPALFLLALGVPTAAVAADSEEISRMSDERIEESSGLAISPKHDDLAYTINEETSERLNRAKRDGRRIAAVGTTSARVLESQPADEPFAAKSAETDIFIYPPYAWKHVRAMVTNFHLPRSSLLMLVSAFAGVEPVLAAYREAIARRYRFYSYGDAMLIT